MQYYKPYLPVRMPYDSDDVREERERYEKMKEDWEIAQDYAVVRAKEKEMDTIQDPAGMWINYNKYAALVEENEQLKRERDEAVALLHRAVSTIQDGFFMHKNEKIANSLLSSIYKVLENKE